jgi:hypothetical protein
MHIGSSSKMPSTSADAPAAVGSSLTHINAELSMTDFLLSGLFFFHFIIPAWPRRPRSRLRLQLLMVVVTMVEMLIMAMSMSIFTKSAWYVMGPDSAMSSMPGMGVSPAVAFSQQQLAAAILWICGDFWAVPCLILIVRRVIQRDGSLLAALDRQASVVSPDAS